MKLVSYDIWDTVLRRRCHPDAVKIHVARQLLLIAGDEMESSLRTAWALFHLRQSIEREIGAAAKGRGLDDEYEIVDVLQTWIGRAIRGDSTRIAWLAERLLEVEVGHEKQIIYADPYIKAHILADRAHRRIFISDFYMPKARIYELLGHVGLAGHFHDGYVSCDVGLNKRSGRLFEHVQNLEGLVADHYHHVGDNGQSDVESPRRLGFSSTLYLPESEHVSRRDKEQRFHQRELLIAELSADEPSGREIRQFARTVAPLLIGFAVYLQEQVLARGLQHLFFFTREGEFFLRLYEALRARSPARSILPAGQLLEVSRISTFGPSLASLDPPELMRLWNLYSTQSPRAFLKTLDLPEDDYAALFHEHGLPLEEPVQYPWQDERMIRLLASPAFQKRAQAQLSARKAGFLDYCQQRGLHAGIGRCGIVDIGWRGTIQDNLACLLPLVQFEGFYLGLNKMLNQQPANTRKHAYGPDLNRNDGSQARSLLEFVAPIEMLTNSPNGSVVGYERRSVEVVAQRLIDESENAVFSRFTQEFQDEIIRIADSHGERVLTDALGSEEIRPQALQLWQDILENPQLPLAQAYFSLLHNESFGVGRFIAKSERLPSLWPLRLMLFPKYRRQFRKQLSELGWTAGYAKLTGDPLLMLIVNRWFRKR